MARRASSQPKWGMIVVVVLLIAVAGGGTWFLAGQLSDPFRTLQPLDLNAYYENANSLQQNQYKIEGVVLDQLKWAPEQGRLLSIEVDGAVTPNRVGVIVPQEFSTVNVQKGQRFTMKVEVFEDGVLLVRDIRKL